MYVYVRGLQLSACNYSSLLSDGGCYHTLCSSGRCRLTIMDHCIVLYCIVPYFDSAYVHYNVVCAVGAASCRSSVALAVLMPQPCPFRHDDPFGRFKQRPSACPKWADYACNDIECPFTHAYERPPPTFATTRSKVKARPS